MNYHDPIEESSMPRALSIVPDNPEPKGPPTVADLKASAELCERQIGMLMRQRNQWQAERQTALVASDMSAARELQSQMKEVDERLSTLRDQQHALKIELESAKGREAAQALQSRQLECERIEQDLEKLTSRLQTMIDEITALYLKDVKVLVDKHQALVPELAAWQTMSAFYQALLPTLLRRNEAQVQGSRACRGTLETGDELMKSGRLEIKTLLESYVRHRKFALSPQPPRAA